MFYRRCPEGEGAASNRLGIKPNHLKSFEEAIQVKRSEAELVRSSKKEHREDALAPTADEGRCDLRKAMGSRKQAEIHGSPNGETRRGEPPSPYAEHIGIQEGTPGTETSKYREEKKENSIPSVVASEEGEGQTAGLRTGGVAGCRRPRRRRLEHRRKAGPKKVTVLYGKSESGGQYQSTAGHVKSCGKPGGPPPKPKDGW